MDKNTLLGLLMMGAVMFGFMYLNKPTEEELERQRQEQAALQQAQQDLDQNEQAVLRIDSITAAHVDQLKAGLKLYGHADSAAATYSYRNADVDLTLAGNELTGTVNTPAGVVDASRILSNGTAEMDPATVAAAVRAIHKTINDISRYKNFASHLSGNEDKIALENDVLALHISTKGGQISDVELKGYDCYLNKDTTRVKLWDADTNAYSFTLTSANQRFETSEFYFDPVVENDSTVLMKLNLGAGCWWGIRYTLSQGQYTVGMHVVQEGMAAAGILPSNLATMEMKWYQKMRRNEEGRMFEERNSAIYYQILGDNVNDLSATSNDDKTIKEPIKWIGFKNQFFSSVLIPRKDFNSAVLESKDLSKDADYLKEMTATAQVNYSTSATDVASFDFYLGPNLYPLLHKLEEDLDPGENLELTRLIPLGWSLFRWINTIIVIPVFTFLGHYISNYGIIILLLTIFIKIILFPFTYKSYMSQAKMRVLAPEIKEINDKYPGKDNAMIRQSKTMELYSRAGANPMSGCLPLMLQMPILIAMFSFFPSCIELRGQSFLWAHDLSAPDAVISWDVNIPFISSTFGNHISLFCILMTVTNILYTRINMQNQPSSNSMPGMKLMMYAMPLMFLFWFNNYAAGLSYYYFLSLLITIVQTYVIRHFIIDEKKVRATMLENAKKPRKKSGLLARLEEAQRQQQALMREQQKGGKRR
ncbi:MAG: membrane protein insertase YidC [Muribaculaceae bacterium]|nr:membrane protein insertase YidC [Muribaculaceae bacterium]